jgi:UDP-glucuronate 4-epimerase
MALATFLTVRVLVTGAAGFIGSHVSAALLDRGDEVVGFDNLNAYYDPALKQARLDRLETRDGFRMVRGDLVDAAAVAAAFDGSPDRPVDRPVDRVVHLAAQAGVRYSLTNPHAYVDSNVTGTPRGR